MLRGGISGLGSAVSGVRREVIDVSGVKAGFMTGAEVGPGIASEERGMSETVKQLRAYFESVNLVESHTSVLLAHAAACSSQVTGSTTRPRCVVDQNAFDEISFPLVGLNNSSEVFVAGVATSDISGSCVDSQDLADSILFVVSLLVNPIEQIPKLLFVLSNRSRIFTSRMAPLKPLQIPEREASLDIAHNEDGAVAMFFEEAESHVEWFHIGHVKGQQSLETITKGRTCRSSVSRHWWFWWVVVTREKAINLPKHYLSSRHFDVVSCRCFR